MELMINILYISNYNTNIFSLLAYQLEELKEDVNFTVLKNRNLLNDLDLHIAILREMIISQIPMFLMPTTLESVVFIVIKKGCSK